MTIHCGNHLCRPLQQTSFFTYLSEDSGLLPSPPSTTTQRKMPHPIPTTVVSTSNNPRLEQPIPEHCGGHNHRHFCVKGLQTGYIGSFFFFFFFSQCQPPFQKRQNNQLVDCGRCNGRRRRRRSILMVPLQGEVPAREVCYTQIRVNCGSSMLFSFQTAHSYLSTRVFCLARFSHD